MYTVANEQLTNLQCLMSDTFTGMTLSSRIQDAHFEVKADEKCKQCGRQNSALGSVDLQGWKQYNKKLCVAFYCSNRHHCRW